MIAWLYPLLSTAIFYLGSQAAITEPLWSRYPERIDELMSCPACVGFWAGVGLQAGFQPELFGLAGTAIPAIIVSGLCSMIVTPLVYALFFLAIHAVNPGSQ